MKKILIVLLAVAILAAAGIAMAGISGTPHDVRSVGGALEPCAFCHTPHQGLTQITPEYPLWNRNQGAQVYVPYTSSTFNMGPALAALDQGSAPCMVCHNGVASGLVNYPGRGSVGNASYNLPGAITLGAWTNLELDLRNEHPVSFTYCSTDDLQGNNFPAEAANLIPTALGINFPLYSPSVGGNATEFSCATCHTVHHTFGGVIGGVEYVPAGNGTGIPQVYFLRTSNAGSGMCAACHTTKL